MKHLSTTILIFLMLGIMNFSLSAAPEAKTLQPEDFTEITFPYGEELIFNEENTVDYNGKSVVLLSFTISNDTIIRMEGYNSSLDKSPFFELYHNVLTNKKQEGELKKGIFSLEPGTYFLMLNDNDYFGIYGEYFSCPLNIQIPDQNIYTDIKYNTVETGKPVSGKMSTKGTYIKNPERNAFGMGYKVNSRAAKTYIVTYTLHTQKKTNLRAEIYYLSGYPLEGDANSWKSDKQESYAKEVNANTLTLKSTITVQGDFRILLLADFDTEVMYTLEIEEPETLVSAISFQQLMDEASTISNPFPFTTNGIFTEGETSLVMGNEALSFRKNNSNYYAVAYKARLTEGNELYIHHAQEDDAYLCIYRLDTSGDYRLIASNDDYIPSGIPAGFVPVSDKDSYSKLTEAGDYCIVACPVGTYNTGGQGAYMLAMWTMETEPENRSIIDKSKENESPNDTLSLPAFLLNHSMLLQYEDLPLIENGSLGYGDSRKMQFKDVVNIVDNDYYAVAYKIALQVDDSIKINYTNNNYAYTYLYLYKNNGAGGYEEVMSDGSNYTSQSYLNFTSSSAEDYYIIATTFNKNTKSDYHLSIWKSAEESAKDTLVLPDFLTNHADTLVYNNELPFVKQSTFGYGDTRLIQFGDTTSKIADNFYAATYHIALEKEQGIKISQNTPSNNSQIYLYKADGKGGYIQLAKSLNNYNNNVFTYSYLDFIAPSAGSYYVVATTQNRDVKDNFYLTIWKSVLESQTSSIKIVSLAASRTSIEIEKEASDLDIKILLSNLTLTGKTSNDVLIPIENSPYGWTISDNRKSAVYTLNANMIENDFYAVESGVKVTVMFVNPTGLVENNISDVAVYAHNNEIYIEGAEQNKQLYVFDIAGRLQVSTPITSFLQKITVTHEGVYIVKIDHEVYKVICK